MELLSRMNAIFEWAHVIDCNCQSVEDDSCYKAFWFLLMIFLLPLSMLLYCLIHIVQKLHVVVFQLLSGQCVFVKSNLYVISFS